MQFWKRNLLILSQKILEHCTHNLHLQSNQVLLFWTCLERFPLKPVFRRRGSRALRLTPFALGKGSSKYCTVGRTKFHFLLLQLKTDSRKIFQNKLKPVRFAPRFRVVQFPLENSARHCVIRRRLISEKTLDGVTIRRVKPSFWVGVCGKVVIFCSFLSGWRSFLGIFFGHFSGCHGLLFWDRKDVLFVLFKRRLLLPHGRREGWWCGREC